MTPDISKIIEKIKKKLLKVHKKIIEGTQKNYWRYFQCNLLETFDIQDDNTYIITFIYMKYDDPF